MIDGNDIDLNTAGESLDFLRTFSGLEVIADSILPSPTRKDDTFERELAYGNPGHLVARGREDVGHIYIGIDTSDVPAYIEATPQAKRFLEAMRSRNRMEPSDTPPIIACLATRRREPGDQAIQIKAYPITQDEYVYLTRETLYVTLPFTGKCVRTDEDLFEIDKASPTNQVKRKAPLPFKIGDDAYFEARLAYLAHGPLIIDFGRFTDPIQKAILYAIAEKTGLPMPKPPSNSGRGIQYAAHSGGMMGARYAQRALAARDALFCDYKTSIPLTRQGVEVAVHTIQEYSRALRSPVIAELQQRHASLLKDLNSIPGLAVNSLLKVFNNSSKRVKTFKEGL